MTTSQSSSPLAPPTRASIYLALRFSAVGLGYIESVLAINLDCSRQALERYALPMGELLTSEDLAQMTPAFGLSRGMEELAQEAARRVRTTPMKDTDVSTTVMEAYVGAFDAIWRDLASKAGNREYFADHLFVAAIKSAIAASAAAKAFLNRADLSVNSGGTLRSASLKFL